MTSLQFQFLSIIAATLLLIADFSTEKTVMEAHTSVISVSQVFDMLSRFHCDFYSSCQKCITKEKINDILRSSHPQESSTDHGTVAIFILVKSQEICSQLEANGTRKTICDSHSCIKEWMDDRLIEEPRGQIVKSKVNTLLRDIGSRHSPATNKCVTTEDIFSETTSSHNGSARFSVSSVTTVIWNHLMRGHCLKPVAREPLERMFEYYETSMAKNLTKVLVLDKKEVERLVSEINRIIPDCPVTLEDEHGHLYRQSGQDENRSSGCLGAEFMFQSTDQDGSLTMDISEFTSHLCPMIIEKLTAASMRQNAQTDKHDNIANGTKSGSEMVYFYGTASITLISLCSLLGALFIPDTKTFRSSTSNAQAYVLTGLISMGFGILIGDAVIHLVPQALGLHGDHSEDVPREHDADKYLGRCIVMVSAIYFLFLFEGVCQVMFSGNHSHKAHDGQSHSMDLTGRHAPGQKSISQQTLTSSAFEGAVQPAAEAQMEETIAALNQSPVICCGLRNLALIVIVGDTIHNLADGLVIGAAFAASINGGITASFAILCHELPHELGDFAILLSTGLSRRRAIIANLLSSLTSYAGFYIGVAIGSNESAIQWTMSVTIGMFLFVALGNMMPELKSLRTGQPWTLSLLQNIAVVIGIGFTIVMAVYEKEINIL